MTENQVEILLVEDNPNDVELTLHAFKSNHVSNFIHVVRDGAEALEYIFCEDQYKERKIENSPKLILLDLKLPKVDGMQVLRKIRSDDRTKSIPVVILTSSDEERDVIESYKLGVNSYIRKPVDFEKFSKVVKDLEYYWLLLNIGPPNDPSR